MESTSTSSPSPVLLGAPLPPNHVRLGYAFGAAALAGSIGGVIASRHMKTPGAIAVGVLSGIVAGLFGSYVGAKAVARLTPSD